MIDKNERNELEEDIEEIETTVKIQSDGRQLFVRIPREVSDYLELKKGDKFTFIVEVSPLGSEEEDGLFFEIERIDNDSKKKAEKKGSSK